MTLGVPILSEYRVPISEYRVPIPRPREESDRLRQGLRTVTAPPTSFVLMGFERSTCDGAPVRGAHQSFARRAANVRGPLQPPRFGGAKGPLRASSYEIRIRVNIINGNNRGLLWP